MKGQHPHELRSVVTAVSRKTEAADLGNEKKEKKRKKGKKRSSS